MAPETKLVEFRKSHPIDFSLLDKDDQVVMYISEDKGDWALHLAIANTSSQSITLADGQGAASSTNHHFALRFRSGTLSKRTLGLLTTEEFKNIVKTPWALAKLEPPAPDAVVTLYLLCTGKKTLAPNEKLSCELSGISAAPGSGSRGTQVELIPNHKQVKFADQTEVTGSRTQYLHVTNHSGRKNIPLHVAIVEGNRVLNGETVEKLTLRITNVLQSKDLGKSATITLLGAASGKQRSKLVLSYDAAMDDQKLKNEDWTLAKADKASKVQVTAADTSVNRTSQAETPQWEITFDKDFPLESRKHLDITIDKLDVSPTPGHANLYLRYENIPGYWDGQFVCTVEKGPIFIKDGKVGIGTQEPKNALDIKGGLVIGSNYAGKKKAPDNGLLVEGALEVGSFDTQSDQHIAVKVAGSAKYSAGIKLLAYVEGTGFSIDYNDKKRALQILRHFSGKTETALEIDVTNCNTSISGGLKVEQALTVGDPKPETKAMAIAVKGKNYLSFGEGLNNGANGHVGYQVYSDGLDIVGAGTGIDRKITLWAEGGLTVNATTVNAVNGLKINLGDKYETMGWLTVTGNVHLMNDLFVHGRICNMKEGNWLNLDRKYLMGLYPACYEEVPKDSWFRKPDVSDLRLKSDIRCVPSALERVRHLRGVTYRWNEDALRYFTQDIETTISAGPNATEQENQEVWKAEREKRRNQLAATEVGVVAQDVESVLPEAVTTDAEGYKLVRYDNLIPLLIEAIKEQDQLAARQQTEIEQLKQSLLVADTQRQH